MEEKIQQINEAIQCGKTMKITFFTRQCEVTVVFSPVYSLNGTESFEIASGKIIPVSHLISILPAEINQKDL